MLLSSADMKSAASRSVAGAAAALGFASEIELRRQAPDNEEGIGTKGETAPQVRQSWTVCVPRESEGEVGT